MRRSCNLLILLCLTLSLAGCKLPGDATPRAIQPAEDVPLHTTWKLDLPAGSTATDVVGVSLVQDQKFLPLSMERGGRRLGLTPHFAYARSTSYAVRVFFSDGKRYDGKITTEDIPKVEFGGVIEVPAAPALGFYYPYLLYIPKEMNVGEKKRLLVEPNDTAISDDLVDHRERARSYLAPRGLTYEIANGLDTPALVPIVPRLVRGPAVHSLNRAALLQTDGPLQRVDLQLKAMIADALGVLAHNGIQMEPTVFMHGFSATSHFVNTFSILHPELLRALAVTGPGGTLTVPAATYQGQRLRYPIGTADLPEMTGQPINMAAYTQIAQFIGMGELDSIDPARDPDVYDPADASLIRDLFGLKVQDRWVKMQTIYGELGIPVQFITYKGLGQQPGPIADVVNFFKANQGNGALTPVSPTPTLP